MIVVVAYGDGIGVFNDGGNGVIHVDLFVVNGVGLSICYAVQLVGAVAQHQVAVRVHEE